MIELLTLLCDSAQSVHSEALPGDYRAILEAVGYVRLKIEEETVFEARSASVPMAILEFANCVWRCCALQIETTLSLMMEPVICFTPQGPITLLRDTGLNFDQEITRISNAELMAYREELLTCFGQEHPALLALIKPLLIDSMDRVSQ